MTVSQNNQGDGMNSHRHRHAHQETLGSSSKIWEVLGCCWMPLPGPLASGRVLTLIPLGSRHQEFDVLECHVREGVGGAHPKTRARFCTSRLAAVGIWAVLLRGSTPRRSCPSRTVPSHPGVLRGRPGGASIGSLICISDPRATKKPRATKSPAGR